MNQEQYFHVPVNSPTSITSTGPFYSAKPERPTRRILRAAIQITIYTLAFLGLAATIREIFDPALRTDSEGKPKFVTCSCGKSVAEAIANGCKYDLLASAWLPEQCRDDELTAEFNKAGPGPNGEWTYYADKEGRTIINATDVGGLADLPGFLYWTTLEWHIVHCYFYWIKAWRIRETGLTIEKRYDTEHHIRHCSKEFLKRDADLQAITTSQGASLMSGEEPVLEIGGAIMQSNGGGYR